MFDDTERCIITSFVHSSRSEFFSYPFHGPNTSKKHPTHITLLGMPSTDRLSDDMDKQLLLSLQSVCNEKGIKLPWDEVGEAMEKQVSGGAIIQHIAKIRQRLAAMGAEVPPPLRRGGVGSASTSTSVAAGHRISTPPLPRQRRSNRASSVASPDMSVPSPLRRGGGNGNPASGSRNIGSATPATPRKRKSPMDSNSEETPSESEEESDTNGDSISETEFGSRRARRNAPKAKGHKTKGREANDNEITSEDENVTRSAGKKRKRDSNVSEMLNREKGPAPSRIHGGINLGDDENQIRSDNPDEQGGERYLGGGAGLFAEYDRDDNPTPRGTENDGTQVANLVTVLKLGQSERTQVFLQSLQEQGAPIIHAESVPYLRNSFISGFDGGGEYSAHGIESRSGTFRNTPKLTHGYGQRFPQTPSSYEHGSFVTNNNHNIVGFGDDTFRNRSTATYNPSALHHRNFFASDPWEFNSMPSDVIATNSSAPIGYSTHMGQQTNALAFPSPNLPSAGIDLPSFSAYRFPQRSGWCAPSELDQNDPEGLRGSFVRPLENYSNEAHRNIPLSAGNPEDVPTSNLYHQESAVRSNQTFVAPVDVLRSDINTVPVSARTSSTQAPGSLSACAPQLQEPAVSSTASLAETSSGNLSAWNLLSPYNSSTNQVPSIENSDWADYLVNFNGSEDILDTNLTSDISSPKNGAV